MTWPDGYYVVVVYDILRRVIDIQESGTTSLVKFSYDDLGRRTAITRPNTTNTQYGYDTQGRLNRLSQYFASAAQDVTYTYGYNQVGDISQVSTSNSLYQWDYAQSGTRSYVSNGLNQYASVNGVAHKHGANGNQVTDGVANYTWNFDSFNRLSAVALPSASASFTYDPEERLSRTTVNGASNDLLYDGERLVAEYDTYGQLSKRYIHGPGVDEPLLSISGTGAKSWLYADHQGSVIAQADATGFSSSYSYGPYGEASSVNNLRFGYTGQQYFPQLGLYHYKARFYDPNQGRFLQNDPIGYQDDMNLYAYVGNNPFNRNDPTGMWAGQAKTFAGEVENTASWYVNNSIASAQSTDLGWVADSLNGLGAGVGAGSAKGVGYVGSMLGWGGKAAAAEKETVSLYRAVGPQELADISSLNALRNLGSAEGKYFTTSAADAAAYAKQAVSSFGDEAYTIVETKVSKGIFNGLTSVPVDGGIPAWVIPNDRLSGLIPTILNYSPLPARGR